MNLILCEKCGSRIQGKNFDSTSGLFCTNCDWCIVTTYIPEIVEDVTKYRVFLLNANSKNINQIKVLSKIANTNYLKAKKMIEYENTLIFEGRASEVFEALKDLDNHSITVSANQTTYLLV